MFLQFHHWPFNMFNGDTLATEPCFWAKTPMSVFINLLVCDVLSWETPQARSKMRCYSVFEVLLSTHHVNAGKALHGDCGAQS